MQKIGIIGGAFDPIHIGHLILAGDVWENVPLDKIVFLVNYHPPHKTVYAPFEDRFNMVKEAVDGIPYFEASDFEARAGIVPSYTVKVLEKYLEYNPDTEPFLIVGMDQVASLRSWYNYEELINMVNFIILKRPGWDTPSDLSLRKVVYLDERLVEISSTEIRERVREGKSIKYLVPERVEKYILDKKLYKV